MVDVRKTRKYLRQQREIRVYSDPAKIQFDSKIANELFAMCQARGYQILRKGRGPVKRINILGDFNKPARGEILALDTLIRLTIDALNNPPLVRGLVPGPINGPIYVPDRKDNSEFILGVKNRGFTRSDLKSIIDLPAKITLALCLSTYMYDETLLDQSLPPAYHATNCLLVTAGDLSLYADPFLDTLSPISKYSTVTLMTARSYNE